jgi:DNA replication protein DnaC
MLANEAKLARRKQIEEIMMRPFSPKDMMQFIESRVPKIGLDKFEIDENNHSIIKLLCKYFTNDQSFETENFKLHKGIMLVGPVGCGKTTLLKLFSANQKASFQIMSCRRLADMYADLGPEILHRFSLEVNIPTSLDTFYQNKIGLCFDDLGTENVKKNFGNASNVMEQIILNRYDNGVPFYFTHLTTNLTVDEIEQMYGTRVRSRMREMFNMIVLTGNDRRK